MSTNRGSLQRYLENGHVGRESALVAMEILEPFFRAADSREYELQSAVSPTHLMAIVPFYVRHGSAAEVEHVCVSDVPPSVRHDFGSGQTANPFGIDPKTSLSVLLHRSYGTSVGAETYHEASRILKESLLDELGKAKLADRELASQWDHAWHALSDAIFFFVALVREGMVPSAVEVMCLLELMLCALPLGQHVKSRRLLILVGRQ